MFKARTDLEKQALGRRLVAPQLGAALEKSVSVFKIQDYCYYYYYIIIIVCFSIGVCLG